MGRLSTGTATSTTISGTSATNITQVSGTAITLGQAVMASSLPVVIASNQSAVSVSAAQSGTWTLGANSGIDIGDVTINNASGGSAVNVQDGGNSITVDNAALSVTGGGLEATALRVTIANDSTGLLSVDDNAGSLTVDNAGLTELAAAINASSQMDVNIAASAATVTVSGSVTANAGTNLNTSALLTSSDFAAAFGTAGTADTQVMSVQGIASMTPVQVGDNSGSLTVDYATTGSGTATGALRVELPTNGTGVVGLNAGTNAIGKLAANSGIDIGDVDILSIAAGDNNIGNVDIASALPAGTNAIGKLAANSGVDIGDVDVTSIAAGTNNIGQVSVAPQTANGLSVFAATSSDGSTALTSTAQAIKASAGQLYGWYIYNPNSSAQFVQLYNTAAASVTVGTTNPLFMLTIPATSAANVEFTNGITFSNAGWSTAATSTAGGNGAPSTALDAVFFYK